MDTNLHACKNLLLNNLDFEGHLRNTDRWLIADDYHLMLSETEIEQPSPDETINDVFNLYLPIHELVADINLLRELSPQDTEIRRRLELTAHKYVINVQTGATIVFFAAIGMGNQTLDAALASEYGGIERGHSTFHNDVTELTQTTSLDNVPWQDEQTRAFVCEKLLPRIHALDAQIATNLEAMAASVKTGGEEKTATVTNITGGRGPAKPIAMTVEEVRAAAAGANVLHLFGPKLWR